MQIFDLKVVESLGLPVEVIDGVPCIVAGTIDFSAQGTQRLAITVPEHDPIEFRNVLPALLGVSVVDMRGARVVITNVDASGGNNVARGLCMPPLSVGQTLTLSALRFVGIQRLNSTTIVIFSTNIVNA